MRSPSRRILIAALAAAVSLSAVACGNKSDSASTGGTTGGTGGGGGASKAGTVAISGSSTVKPISQRVAELMEDTNPNVKVTVDGPGTGDGFKLFCKGEIDIADASRPITKEEAADCQKNGVEYIELKVGIDGLTVITNPANNVDCLNKNDLYALIGQEAEGKKNWADAQALATELGSKTTFPSASLDITAPGTESGTYDSFYELSLQKIAEDRAKNGKAPADDKGKPKAKTRKDYSSQANDNAILTGIEGSKSSLGWVGFAYAEEAGDKVKEIKVDGGKGCIEPTATTIASNEYPLSRSLYIYVNTKRMASNPSVKEYVDFYLSDAGLKAVTEVKYIALGPDALAQTRKVWEAKTTGSRDGNKS